MKSYMCAGRASAMRATIATVSITTAAAAALMWLWRRRPLGGRRFERRWQSEGLAAGASDVCGAGLGLYALRAFEEGETVAIYRGERLSMAKMLTRENRDYIMGGFGLNRYVDALNELDCPARYVNDSFDKAKLNARFSKDAAACTAAVVALRHIAAGEEIFASYGEDYWLGRGIDPATGAPHEPDEETLLGLRLLERAREQAKARAASADGDRRAPGSRAAERSPRTELRTWTLSEPTGILVVESYAPDDAALAPAVVSYIAVDEALRLEPYAACNSGGGDFSPRTEAEAMAVQQTQRRAHEATVAGRPVLGYAHWLSGRCTVRSEPPLIFRETFEHTGTRIWEGAWLHRAWALQNARLFQNRSVLELGAGCGMLGVSVACACRPTSVTLTDFRGHFQSSETVMHCLRGNVARNVARLPPSATVRVLELDWQRPTEPLEWPLPEGDAGAGPAPSACPCAPCDVVIGTEVLYSAEGAILLAALLPVWLSRPHGTAYVLNNANRTGVDAFARACAQHGLSCEEIPISSEQSLAATCTLEERAHTHDAYVHFMVRRCG